MSHERKLELLVYASICFEHCTSPFEHRHLLKLHISADECKTLSTLISIAIDHEVLFRAGDDYSNLYAKASKAFKESQE